MQTLNTNQDVWGQFIEQLALPEPRPDALPVTRKAPGICAHPGCRNEGEPLYFDDDRAVIWFCDEHMTAAGFCGRCHKYVADVEVDRLSLVFHGCCHNCWVEIHR